MEMMSTTSLIEMEMWATSTATTSSEEAREYVIKVHVIKTGPSATLSLSLFMFANALFATLVIHSALVGIGESFVRWRYLLEFRLGGLGVILVLIGMILYGKLLKCLLDLGFGRVLFNTHELVVIFAFLFGLFLLLLLLVLMVSMMLLLSLLLSPVLGHNHTWMTLIRPISRDHHNRQC